MKRVLRYRFICRRSRTIALICVAVFELGLIGFLWHKSAPKVMVGYLIKNALHFNLGWRSDDGSVQVRAFQTLDETVQFANKELGLRVAQYTDLAGQIERVWITRRDGLSILHWKLFDQFELNRLTFQNEKEAEFFASTFKTGGYSASFIGHAMLFVPDSL